MTTEEMIQELDAEARTEVIRSCFREIVRDNLRKSGDSFWTITHRKADEVYTATLMEVLNEEKAKSDLVEVARKMVRRFCRTMEKKGIDLRLGLVTLANPNDDK